MGDWPRAFAGVEIEFLAVTLNFVFEQRRCFNFANLATAFVNKVFGLTEYSGQ